MNTINQKVERALEALKKEYVFVNEAHISLWKASLIIGIIVGVAGGIIFVANRSGELEKTGAKGITPSLTVSPVTFINKESVLQNDSLNVEYVAPEDGSLKKASVVFSPYKSPAAATEPASCSKMPIDTEDSSQWFPVILGRYITYQEIYSLPWDITLYDLVTRRKQRLTDVLKSGGSLNVDISGNRIVYQKIIKEDSYIYLYDISTNTEKRITNTLTSHFPAIDGDKIVWYDKHSGDQSDIYLYNLTNNAEQRITSTPDNEGMPDISGNYIVYEGKRGGNWVVSLYDILTNSEQIITPPGAKPYWPKISGNWVVYYDKRNTNSPGWYDLYAYNILTRTEQRITQAPTILFDFLLTKGAGISGNIVTWADARNSVWDIYAYDITTKTEFQITNDSAFQWAPSISGRRIVWTDIGIHNEGDIYLLDDTRPTPDIKANGSDGPIELLPKEPLSVTISLDPGCPEGKSADWWAYAVTPFGTYWATPQGWIHSDEPIRGYAGPLAWVLPTPILQSSNAITYKNTLIFPLFPVGVALPTGDYTFSFTVDDSMDGVLNGNIYRDEVLIRLKK